MLRFKRTINDNAPSLTSVILENYFMRSTTWMNIVGVVFILLGLIGFFNNPLLGVFEVNVWNNLIFLATGVLALTAANMGEITSRNYSKFFGFFYLILMIIGFFVGDTGEVLGFIANNQANNILYLVFAAAFLIMGYGYSPSSVLEDSDTRVRTSTM